MLVDAVSDEDAEPVAWGVFCEPDSNFEYISNHRSMANDHINNMDCGEISKMRLIPLYLAPPPLSERMKELEECLEATRQYRDTLEIIADNARAENAKLREKAMAVIDRWNSPKWKEQAHTAVFIHELRQACYIDEALEKDKQ
jgi:hypothetical protein